jgi:inorganic pyrophosphatase
MEKKTFQAIIETPRGSRNKFKYDQTAKMFKLDKVLPSGFAFPYDFGYIPNTMAGDGDPLDILVMTDEGTFTGCLIDCRILGAITAKQTEDGETVQNDRIIGVPEKCFTYNNLSSLKQLDENLLKEIEHFFISYHEYNGVKFKPNKITGPQAAIELIEAASNGDN